MTAEILAATEHLVLRRMTNDDAAALAADRSDPVQARYQSWETPYPLDSARALIAQMRNVRFAQPGVWLQIGIETSGRLIGDIAVRVDGDQARQATVGFTLATDAQGHGYATEALRTVISLLFTEHDVHRICADCDTRNDRSVSLLERVGTRREAHHHKSAWWKGEWTDEYVYAMEALLSEIKADAALGSSLGVKSTPTFFINGRRIAGGMPPAAFEAAIELELG